jgi:hypothetical protein
MTATTSESPTTPSTRRSASPERHDSAPESGPTEPSASALSERLAGAKRRLREHPLYPSIRTADQLRRFTERHVACVWDFMSLLKSLQRELTSVSVPWLPPVDRESARFINEITLGEESDVDPSGRPISHFEWYLEGMAELGADRGPIEALIEALRRGEPIGRAFERSTLPPESVRFLRSTFAMIERPIHVRAAVFFHGREDIIPGMFVRMVEELDAGGLRCPTLVSYLKRHIEADGEHHGPLAARLQENLFAGLASRRLEAMQAAIEAVEARIELWDAIHADLIRG